MVTFCVLHNDVWSKTPEIRLSSISMPPVISTTNADSESEDDDYVPPADEQGRTFFDLFMTVHDER